MNLDLAELNKKKADKMLLIVNLIKDRSLDRLDTVINELRKDPDFQYCCDQEKKSSVKEASEGSLQRKVLNTDSSKGQPPSFRPS